MTQRYAPANSFHARAFTLADRVVQLIERASQAVSTACKAHGRAALVPFTTPRGSRVAWHAGLPVAVLTTAQSVHAAR